MLLLTAISLSINRVALARYALQITDYFKKDCNIFMIHYVSNAYRVIIIL